MTDDLTDLWTRISLLVHHKHRDQWDARPGQLRELLQQGADPNAGREAPLLMAARINHPGVTEVLLDFGADVHAGNTWQTPLMLAGGHAEMRSLLLSRGARDTAFSFLACGESARFEQCLEEEPGLVHTADEVDKTLVFYAAGRHDGRAAKRLLEAGADANAVAARSYGISPIHEACRGHASGGADVIRLLQAHGAELGAGDQGGVTGLHMAVRDRNVDAVRSLLELGAPVDAEDRGRKSTPLRRAVANTGLRGTDGKLPEALEIVQLLVEYGANPLHKNRGGKTVIESTVNPAIMTLLLRSV